MSELMHWGDDPMGAPTQHRGLKEDCPAPECGHREDCVFCQIIAGVEQAEIVAEWPDAIAFVPSEPIVDGHLLVVPRIHVADFGHVPSVSAATMYRAAQLASTQWCNVLTNRGKPAGQRVFHLHVHLIPRKSNDGLKLIDGNSRKGSR